MVHMGCLPALLACSCGYSYASASGYGGNYGASGGFYRAGSGGGLLPGSAESAAAPPNLTANATFPAAEGANGSTGLLPGGASKAAVPPGTAVNVTAPAVKGSNSSAGSIACNHSTLMQRLECLEPERYKKAGNPVWAWLAMNGISGVGIVGLLLVCACCSVQLVRSSRELRQFRAPLQEEVMELSENSLSAPSAPIGARAGSRRESEQGSTGPYSSMK
mmetsp:Transcript_68218/g.158309  ORF Transcript_68218/g.158309 Transcript_68218/m.158309 type:complete len:219 (+) Transcript_68218:67-723(+)